jgi:hypothetical protein
MTGALWDVYEELRSAHGGDSDAARTLATQALHEAIKHLPKPTAADISPVTFRRLSSELVNASALLSFSAADQSAVQSALTARGLYGSGNQVSASWAQVGPGIAGTTPGIRVQDNPVKLKSWVYSLGGDPNVVTQGVSTSNSKPDAGEVVALWFDIRDVDAVTAGGVLVKVTSPDTDISFLNGYYNYGSLSSSQVQIRYGKVNGTGIVAALSTGSASFAVPTSNTYFKTDPYFDETPTVGIWTKIAPGASHGKVVNLQVELVPTNGPSSTLSYPVTIN